MFAAELRNVTKDYGSTRAVDDLSFALPFGAIYGFLGQNGAGKTTTIRILLDIIKPSSGSLTILGATSALKVRHRVGYLPEEKGLYKKMKVWAVIAYFGTLKGLNRKEAKTRAMTLLERYGLKDFAEKPTDALSKGMGQKVQVLASIVHDPEFVILDEPFSGLDPVNQEVMEEIIRDMARRGRTILFSTHVMQHAERLCDRILLIAKGKKIFDGTIPEAQRMLPQRVRIETEENMERLNQIPNVLRVQLLAEARSAGDRAANLLTSTRVAGEHAATARTWELEMSHGSDPQLVLQFCFEQGIRLRAFSQSPPSLHEVFMTLAGGSSNQVTPWHTPELAGTVSRQVDK